MHDLNPKLVETFVGGAVMFVFYALLKLVFSFVEKMRSGNKTQQQPDQTPPLITSTHYDFERLNDRLEYFQTNISRQLDDLKDLTEKCDERFLKLAETNMLQLELIKGFANSLMQFLRKNGIEK